MMSTILPIGFPKYFVKYFDVWESALLHEEIIDGGKL